jgi:hypothetical protein
MRLRKRFFCLAAATGVAGAALLAGMPSALQAGAYNYSDECAGTYGVAPGWHNVPILSTGNLYLDLAYAVDEAGLPFPSARWVVCYRVMNGSNKPIGGEFGGHVVGVPLTAGSSQDAWFADDTDSTIQPGVGFITAPELTLAPRFLRDRMWRDAHVRLPVLVGLRRQ